MRTRMLGLLGGAVLLSMLPLQMARADFHPACTTSPINAYVGLQLTGDDLVFSGTVTCKGAASVTITSLLVEDSNGRSAEAPTASCIDPCDSAVTTSGTIAAVAGVYDVSMTFTVTGHDGRTYSPSRAGQWAWAGEGTPLVKTCPATNFPPPFNACV